MTDRSTVSDVFELQPHLLGRKLGRSVHNRSIGDAALQAGNSETIVRRHYLNLHPSEEGQEFFRIVPTPENRMAVVRKAEHNPNPAKLRAL